MSKEKIKFYEEVLELEPGSRLFYPLAQLHADEGENERALEVLRQGLKKYPEHFEARLLMASLLMDQGGEQQAREIFKEIFSSLQASQRFWPEVSVFLRAEGKTDMALAAAFFARASENSSLSWTEILTSGLNSLTSSADASQSHVAMPEAVYEQEQSDRESRTEPAPRSDAGDDLDKPAQDIPTDLTPLSETVDEPHESELEIQPEPPAEAAGHAEPPAEAAGHAEPPAEAAGHAEPPAEAADSSETPEPDAGPAENLEQDFPDIMDLEDSFPDQPVQEETLPEQDQIPPHEDIPASAEPDEHAGPAHEQHAEDDQQAAGPGSDQVFQEPVESLDQTVPEQPGPDQAAQTSASREKTSEHEQSDQPGDHGHQDAEHEKAPAPSNDLTAEDQPEQLHLEPEELYEEPEELSDFELDPESRTRSMADILMGQEEYAKALSIYKELWRESLPGEERNQLEMLINQAAEAVEKLEQSGEEPVQEQKKAAVPEENRPAENNSRGDNPPEALNFLKNLADRLEARSSSSVNQAES